MSQVFELTSLEKPSVSGPLFADEWKHSEASFDPFLIKHFINYDSNKWTYNFLGKIDE